MVELNKFYKGECVKFLKEKVESNSINLTITSPPYDNLRKYKGYLFDYKSIAEELFRVTTEGGIVVWIVSDSTINGSETGSSFKQALYFKEVGFNLHDTMIWVKPNPIPQIKRKRYTNAFEYMFVFSKGVPNTCNYLTEPCKNAGKDMSKSSYKNYSAKDDNERKLKDKEVNKEKIRTNVWEIKVGSGSSSDKISFNHPATFPEEVALNHILTWSNEGDIVLDCMCGSGTVPKIAYLNNRNFIGIEINEEYVNNICIPRLQQYGWSNELHEAN